MKQLTKNEIKALIRLVINEEVENPQFTDELKTIENKLTNMLEEEQ